MVDFPTSIFAPRTVANVDGVTYEAEQTTRVFAEDINKATDEIVAIENILGLNPEGDFDTVVERLDSFGGSEPFKLPGCNVFISGQYITAGGTVTPRQYTVRLVSPSSGGGQAYLVQNAPYGLEPFVQSDLNFFEFTLGFAQNASLTSYILFGSNEALGYQPGIGLKVVGDVAYACLIKWVDEVFTEVTSEVLASGANITAVWRVVRNDVESRWDWYKDDVLVGNIAFQGDDSNINVALTFTVESTSGAGKTMQIGNAKWG